MAFDWPQYAVGGAARPDSFSGMQPQFQSALSELFAAAPENIRSSLRVSSGFRSPERQKQLWEQALQKYGSPEAARKWVAPPGRSQHNHGNAADLKYLSDEARKWAHTNASRFGLAFPLGNENWHIELAGARGGGHNPNDGHNHGPTAAAPVMAQAAPAAAAPIAAPTSLAAAFADPTQGQIAAPAQPALGDLASLFFQQQQDRQQRRAEQQQADAMRRQALFGQDSLAGLFGA